MSENYWSKTFEERVVYPPFAFNHYKIFVYEQHDIQTGETLSVFGAYGEPFEQPFRKAGLSPFHVVNIKSKEAAMSKAKETVDEAYRNAEVHEKVLKKPLPKIAEVKPVEAFDYKCCKVTVTLAKNGKYLATYKVVEQPFINTSMQAGRVQNNASVEDAIAKTIAKIDKVILKNVKSEGAGGIDNIPY